MISIYKNKEVKALTYKIIVVHLALILAILVVFKINLEGLNKEYIRTNKVIAARLIGIVPSAKNEIMEIYSKGINGEDIEASENILSEYGYKEDLEVYKNPVINSFNKKILIEISLLISIFSLLIYIVIIKNQKIIYNKIKEFSKAAEDVVENRFNNVFLDNEEGDLSILGNQFNNMSERLEESLNKLKEDKLYLKNVISDISHQLKTPLAALILFNGIMENDEDMNLEERRDLLQSSREQLDRMDWLSKNLIKLARLEAGAVIFKKEKTSLKDTLRKSIAPLMDFMRSKEQEFILECDEIIFAHDGKWTSEAFINIIKNAIEHTDTKGKIEVVAEETALTVQICIKDDGEGISKNDIGKIFNRFYKGESSTNPASVGIGLALSKSIIEEQGGSISVKSKQGYGTEFTIIFLKTII